VRVKLTVKCKLDVPSSSLEAINDTFSRYRKACEYISGVAHETRTFGKVSLHHRVYYPVRQRYGLPAQLACTARDKVAEAYRRDKTRRHQFKRECVRLDARTFRLIAGERCSFTTCAGGRVKASLVVGDYQRELLSRWETTGAAEKVRKSQRARHSSWAFAQLREFLRYKAAKASVYLAVVDPRNTSRTCNECGHCEKANRQGETFRCRSCGHTADSDINGARNIGAAVNLPNGPVANVACVDSSTHSYKPTALAVGS
jgi:transposase